MKNVREYAASVGHEVVGKLARHAELERKVWSEYHEKFLPCEYRLYMDETGNEYSVGKDGVCIVTTDGTVI